MKIFITGANGQLGMTILERVSEDTTVYTATKELLDVSDQDDVLRQITKFHPDIVFHFASVTRGDENAKDPEAGRVVNVLGTKNVISACKATGAALLFVSTNEVFDGDKNVPYGETDTPHPITVVGKAKLEAEELIRKSMLNYYIIRTMWLYSRWSGNFLHNVLEKARTHKKVSVVTDEIGSPTSSSDLADAIFRLLPLKKYGTYHLVNEGIVSRFDFARKAFSLCNLEVEMNPITMDEYIRASKPPRFSALQNTRAAKLGIMLPSWEDALARFLQENKLINSL